MAYDDFDEVGCMKPSSYYERLVDVMEELMNITLLTRDRAADLIDRYSEREAEGRIIHGAEHVMAATG